MKKMKGQNKAKGIRKGPLEGPTRMRIYEPAPCWSNWCAVNLTFSQIFPTKKIPTLLQLSNQLPASIVIMAVGQDEHTHTAGSGAPRVSPWRTRYFGVASGGEAQINRKHAPPGAVRISKYVERYLDVSINKSQDGEDKVEDKSAKKRWRLGAVSTIPLSGDEDEDDSNDEWEVDVAVK